MSSRVGTATVRWAARIHTALLRLDRFTGALASPRSSADPEFYTCRRLVPLTLVGKGSAFIASCY